MTTDRGRSLQPERVAANLARFQRIPIDRPDLRQASVALCLQRSAGGGTLLITRRAQSLRNHAGQWALPGGRRDEGESIEDAALRELREETGVSLAANAVLGLLDDYVTRSGYLMTPVVVWGGAADGELTAAPAEVARIFQVPLTDLDVQPEFLAIPQAPGPVIRLPLFDRHVHAPTAAIIYQFCQVALHDRTLRVAHFEAPVHLWR
ncbi:MAG TPA: CoA pyrophosphatase [Streptosporangiaceae bacterium]|nr:CoA pyrophosphatase [Streptosporangiaceae bacterium]